MSEPQDWVWMPHAAHFILGHQCRFHLATYVGGYIVSTVGELVNDTPVQKIHAKIHDPAWFAQHELDGGGQWRNEYHKRFGFEKLGAWGTYETLVFRAEPQRDREWLCCPWEMAEPEELDGRRYDSAVEATDGHMAMCWKWASA